MNHMLNMSVSCLLFNVSKAAWFSFRICAWVKSTTAVAAVLSLRFNGLTIACCGFVLSSSYSQATTSTNTLCQ